MPWRNFPSPEFRKKFQREVPYFWRHLSFLTTRCRTGRKKPSCQKQMNSFIPFDRTTPTSDTQTQTDRQTDRHRTIASTRDSAARVNKTRMPVTAASSCVMTISPVFSSFFAITFCRITFLRFAFYLFHSANSVLIDRMMALNFCSNICRFISSLNFWYII